MGWAVADAVQPAAYSALRQTVSVAAGHGGRDRWIMTSALLVVGSLYAATAAGLREVTPIARAGLVIAGAAAIGIALCPEPRTGSTPGHQLCTGIGELTIAIWPALMLSRGARAGRSVTVSRLCAIATVLCLALLAWLIVEVVSDGGLLGLAERIGATTQVTLPFFVALLVRAERPEPPGRIDA